MSWCNLGQFLKLSERTAIRKVTETQRRLSAKLHRKQETVKKEARQDPWSERGQKRSFGSWVLKRGPCSSSSGENGDESQFNNWHQVKRFDSFDIVCIYINLFQLRKVKMHKCLSLFPLNCTENLNLAIRDHTSPPPPPVVELYLP